MQWKTAVAARVSGRGCPYCSNRRVLPGFNDLATIHPEIAAQWDTDRNGDITPSDVMPGSITRVWWRCSQGHSWLTSVGTRSKGYGCPYCSNRKVLPGYNDLATRYPEIAAQWDYERNTDFAPDKIPPHFMNHVWWRCEQGHSWSATVVSRVAQGRDCPFCSGHKVLKGFNDLASNYPELAAEWSEKNAPLQADKVFPKSRKNVWWKCRVCAYEWRAVIDSRVKGMSCPVCTDRAVKSGWNDLATTDPDLIIEWDYDRNTVVTPEKVSRCSMRMIWWKCRFGHSWRAKISDRAIDKEPCHICLKMFEKEFPDLLLRHYLEVAGYEVIIDEEELIGVPLANYLREKNAVIEFSKPLYNTKVGYRIEYAKTQLCRRAKIKMIRILKQKDKEFEDCVNITRLDNSDEALTEAIKLALKILKINLDTGLEVHREYLFQQYINGSDQVAE